MITTRTTTHHHQNQHTHLVPLAAPTAPWARARPRTRYPPSGTLTGTTGQPTGSRGQTRTDGTQDLLRISQLYTAL